MRYDKTLSATIDGSQYHYIEHTDAESTTDPMCFAVELCHEAAEPPVHMQISTTINDILVSQYLQHLSSRQWNIHFNTVSLYKNPKLKESVQFWNGVRHIEPPDIPVDVSINLDAEAVLKKDSDDGSLNITLEFIGSASINYRVSIAFILL